MRLTVIVVLLLLPAILACSAPQGPGGAQTGSTTPRVGGVLNMAVSNEVIDYDPSYNGKSSPGDNAQAQAFNALLVFKSGPDVPYSEMILGPALAERWEVAPDGATFTFHLRKGVKFAKVPPVNGREFTSADVRWTMEYYARAGEFKEKKLPASLDGVYYEGFKGVETPDPYTARVTFSEPFAPFISYAASTTNPILPREVYEADGHLKDRIIGTGPYQLDVAASQKGTRWVWKKHPNAWQTTYVDEIRWLVLPEDSMQFAAFQTKQADINNALAYRSFEEVQKQNPQAVAFRYQQPQGYHLHFSQVRGGPLTNVRVRRAMSMAIDRDEVNRLVAGGEGEWAMTGAMHGLFTEAEAHQFMKFDPEGAKRLMAEAGYANGITIEWPFEDATTQDNLAWYQLVQARWKQIGVNLALVPMDKTLQRQKRRVGDFDIDVVQGLGVLEADADSILFGGYHSKGSINYGKSKDPELDRMLEAQRQEADPQKRRELMRVAVRRIVDRAWGTELVYPPKWDVTQPYVKGYYPHFSVKSPYITAWLDR